MTLRAFVLLAGTFLGIVTFIRLYVCAGAGGLCYVGRIGDCGCFVQAESTT